VTAKSWGTAPFGVAAAAVAALCKAAFLIFMGVIGVATADDVSDPFGGGVLVFGIVYAVVGLALPRGSRLARNVLAALTVIPVVVGVVYMFTGPAEAIVPSLVAVALALGVLALLFWPETSRAYFEDAPAGDPGSSPAG
jgi:hypothetical protein